MQELYLITEENVMNTEKLTTIQNKERPRVRVAAAYLSMLLGQTQTYMDADADLYISGKNSAC